MVPQGNNTLASHSRQQSQDITAETADSRILVLGQTNQEAFSSEQGLATHMQLDIPNALRLLDRK